MKINDIIYESMMIIEDDEEDDEKKKRWKLALGLGGALLGGAVASQTHTGKAIYHGLKSKLSSNIGTKISSGSKALYHGVQSPFLRKPILKAGGKFIAKAAGVGGLAYGAKKAYDYSKTPEGQQKINDMKNTIQDKLNSAKNTISTWFNKPSPTNTNNTQS